MGVFAVRYCDPGIGDGASSGGADIEAQTPAVEGAPEVEQQFEALKRGEIPARIIEDLRLLDPDSSIAQSIHKTLTQYAEHILKSEGFREAYRQVWGHEVGIGQQSYRFVVSDTSLAHRGLNSVRFAEPRLVIIEKALLEQFENPAQIIFFLAKAMIQGEVVKKYEDREKNLSYPEAVVTAGFAFRIVNDLGYDPNQTRALYLKSVADSKKGRISYVSDLFPREPNEEITELLVDGILGSLRGSRGALDSSAAPISLPVLDTAQIKLARHRSFVQENLTAVADYAHQSASEKLHRLTSLIAVVTPGYAARVNDIAAELTSLKGKFDSETDRPALDRFADTVLEAVAKRSIKPEFAIPLLTNLGILPRHGERGTPYGRLTGIQEKIAAIHADCSKQSLHKNLPASCRALMAALGNEPLYKTSAGRRLLMSIAWSKFPKGEEIKVGTKVPWQPLHQAAKGSPQVLEAAFALGLASDIRFLYLLPGKPALGLSLCQGILRRAVFDSDNKEYFPQMVKGPLDHRAGKQNFVIDDEGLKIKRVTENDLELLYREAITFALQGLIKAVFTQPKDQPDRVSKAVQLCQAAVKIQHSFTLDPALILIDPDLYCAVLPHVNLERSDGVGTINSITSLVETQGREARATVRRLFGVQDDGSIGASRLVQNYNDVAGLAPSSRASYSVGSTPIHEFIFNDPLDIFTPSERVRILNVNLALTIEHLCNDRFIAKAQERDFDKQAQSIFDRHVKIFRSAGLYTLGDNPTPAEVIQAYGGFTLPEQGTSFSERPATDFLLYLQTKLWLANDSTRLTFEEAGKIAALISPLEGQIRSDSPSTSLAKRIEGLTASAVDHGPLRETVSAWEALVVAKCIPDSSIPNQISTLTARLSLVEGSIERAEMALILLASTHLGDPQTRTTLRDIWVSDTARLLGRDTNDVTYAQALEPHLSTLRIYLRRSDRDGNERRSTEEFQMLSALAEAIEAQPILCAEIERQATHLSFKDLALANLFGSIGDSAVRACARSDIFRTRTLEFLLSPLEDLSVAEYIITNFSDIYGTGIVDGPEIDDFNGFLKLPSHELKAVDPSTMNSSKRLAWKSAIACHQTVTSMHEKFRAVAPWIQSILVSYLALGDITGDARKPIYEKAITNAVAGSDSDSITARTVLTAFFEASQAEEGPGYLAALLLSNIDSRVGSTTLAKGLKVVLANGGSGGAKIGQGISTTLSVRPDIRAEFASGFTHNANPLQRWERSRLLELVREEATQMYRSYLDRIGTPNEAVVAVRHGKGRGHGSMNFNEELVMSDGATILVSIPRPFCVNQAQTVFGTVRAAMKIARDKGDQASINEFGVVVDELLEEADRRVAVEGNCILADTQFSQFHEWYGERSIQVDGITVNVNTPTCYGAGKKCYLMSPLSGEHLADIDPKSDSEHQRVRAAKMAGITLEINSISNLRFELDRTGGNELVDLGPDDYSVSLNRLDPKAIEPELDLDSSASQFARIIWTSIIATVAQKITTLSGGDLKELNFLDHFTQTQMAVRRSGEAIGSTTRAVNKAASALGHFFDGLSEADIKRAVLSGLMNPIRPEIKEIYLTELDKLVSNLPFGLVIKEAATALIGCEGKLADGLAELLSGFGLEFTSDSYLAISKS